MNAPYFPLVLTVLSWGTNFVAIKVLYNQMTPAAVGLVRFVLMLAIVVGICLVSRESLKFPKGKAIPVLWQGFLSMGLYMVLFFEGMKRTGASEGAIILSSSPVIVALLAVIFRVERFCVGAIVGASVAFSGVALVVVGGGVSGTDAAMHERLIGDLLVFLSACVWGFQALMSRAVMKEMTPFRLLALGMPAAALILVPYGAADTLNTDWSGLTWTTWGALGHLTVFAGIVGFVGFYKGVAKLGPSRTLLYQFFVPPTAAITEWAMFGKSLTAIQFLGLGVTIAGVWLSSRARAAMTKDADALTCEAEAK